MKLQAPRGTADVLPDQSGNWLALEAALRSVCKRFGYDEMRFPTFEHTELFLRGIGDETDVVQKEMYTFLDKAERSITLRPEGTASVARAFVEHGLYAGAMPLKLYYIAPNFRYERPGAGRLREHHQFGVELFGSAAPEAEAEVVGLAAQVLDTLGLSESVTLKINSIGCPGCRRRFLSVLRSELARKADQLCSTCSDRLERNPMRILDCKNKACQELCVDLPLPLEYLCEDCSAHFFEVKANLAASDIPFNVEPRIVRGLDYYTRTVFEFVADIEGETLTVCGGGRYDSLIAELDGPETPALGFGMGLERLLHIISQVNPDALRRPTLPLVFIASVGPECAREALKLTAELRRLGRYAEIDLCGRSLKAQMKHADRLGARWVIVIGNEEMENKIVTIKHMRGGGSKQVPFFPDAISRNLDTVCAL